MTYSSYLSPQLHPSSYMLMIFSYHVSSNHPMNFHLHNLTLIFSLPGSNLNTSDYPLLLKLFNLPSLSSHRTTSKLVLLYKFIFSKLYIPAGSFSFQNQSFYNLCCSHPLNLNLPFSRSSTTLNFFLTSAFFLWNFLPSSFKDLNSAVQPKYFLFTLELSVPQLITCIDLTICEESRSVMVSVEKTITNNTGLRDYVISINPVRTII